MTELDLINAIEGLTRRLSCVSFALWIIALTGLAAFGYYLWYYHHKR